MNQYKIDYKLTLDDFIEIENIEHTYFESDNITNAQEVWNWYKKNNLTCVAIRDKNSNVVGSINILPLKEKVFNDIYNNKINESNIVAEDILQYEDKKSYYMYLSSISIKEELLNNYEIITTLLRGALGLFNKLENKNIKIKKLMADASTIHGEKICRKLLKMDFIIKTSHNSKIYCSNEENIYKEIQKLRKKLL